MSSDLVVVRPYLYNLLGDAPGLHGMIAMMAVNSLHGCHLCCFPSTKGSTVYDPDVHRSRSFVEQAKAQQVFVDEYLQDYGQATVAKKVAKRYLEKWKAQVRDGFSSYTSSTALYFISLTDAPFILSARNIPALTQAHPTASATRTWRVPSEGATSSTT